MRFPKPALALCLLVLGALCASGCSNGGGGSSTPASYTITANADTNGSIQPSGTTSVKPGTTQVFTITPAPGYLVSQLTVDGAPITGDVSGYTFMNVQGCHDIQAAFALAPVTYRIVVGQTANGTISPATTVTASGASPTFTFTPNAGYLVSTILVDGVALENANGQLNVANCYTFQNVSADHSLSVVYALPPPSTYGISANAGTHGSITPSGSVIVAPGANQTFTFTPSPGYLVDQVTVDGAPIAGDVSSYTFIDVLASHTINATFVQAPVDYSIIVAQAANGSIAPGTTPVAAGASQTFTFTPNSGCTLSSLLVDGLSQAITGNSYTFQNVSRDHSLVATFAPPAAASYPITASAGPNGGISPSGTINAGTGASQTFTFTPSPGYQVDQITVDGTCIAGNVSSYMFSNVQASHTVYVTFAPASTSTFAFVVNQAANGTISPGSLRVAAGLTQSFTLTPNPGYSLCAVVVDGTSVTPTGNTCTFQNVSSDHSISALFSPTAYSIVASTGPNGAIAPAGTSPVLPGASRTYTITPATGFLVGQVLVDGNPIAGAVTSYTFANVQGNHSISASFVQAPAIYTIFVNTPSNGTVSPGSTLVSGTANQTFTFKPAAGYQVSAIIVDGVAAGAVGNAYTFQSVASNHNLEVDFGPSPAGNSITQAYGVAVNLGSPINADTGSAVSNTYNPLGGMYCKLDPRQGIYLTGYNTPNTANWWGDVILWPDQTSGTFDFGGYLATNPEWTEADTSIPTPSWLACPHASAAGDLDGSGADSVVTVYYCENGNYGEPTSPGNNAAPNTGSLSMVIASPNSPKPFTQALVAKPNQEFYVPSDDRYDGSQGSQEMGGQIQVALCDLNGDGNKELAVAVDSSFMIFQQTSPGVWGMAAGPYQYRSGSKYSGWWTCRLAVGDINGDGKDEIVVTESQMLQGATPAIYHVYGSQDGTYGELARGPVVDQAGNFLVSANVAIGDLFGDGGREIVFSGAGAVNGEGGATSGSLMLATWQSFNDGTGSGTLTLPGGAGTVSQGMDGAEWYPFPSLCMHQSSNAAGVAGMAPQALVALNGIWTWNNALATPTFNQVLALPGMYDQGTGYQVMAAGNVLGATDNSDQLVAPYWDLGKHQTMYIYSIDNATGTPQLDCQSSQLSNWGGMASNSQTNTMFRSLCLPDWSGLSQEVKFAGRSATQFSNPLVLTLLSAPPYYLDILNAGTYGNLGNCFTQFGTSTSSGFEQSSSFTFTASLSFGFKYQDELTQTEAEMKASISASLTHSSSKSSTQSVSQEFLAPYQEDEVVYTVIPYDVYNYVLAKQPGGATQTNGFTINVPRQPQMTMMSVSGFNALPSNPCQVDPAVLGHTIGSPWSYPDYGQAQNLMASGGLWDPNGVPVGFNNSYVSDEVEQTHETSSTLGVGFGISLDFEVVAGGVLFGSSLDFQGEVDATCTTGVGTTISGSSPGLPPGLTPPADTTYWFGICAYPVTISTQSTPATLVNYWVNANQP